MTKSPKITAILIVAILSAVMVGSQLIYTKIFPENTLPIMILFVAVVCLPFLVSWAKRTYDSLEPIYLWIVFYSFLYLITPVIQLVRGTAFISGGEYLNKALILAILGLSFFYLGYYLRVGKKIAKIIPVIKSEISSRKLFYIAWALIIIGFLGFDYFIHISGGWISFWQKPHGYGGATSITTAYLYQLPELMIIGFILLFEIFIHKRVVEKKPVTIWSILNLFAAAIGGVGIYTLAMGSRAYAFWVAVAMILIYFLKKQSRPKPVTSILILFLLFVMIVTIPSYRTYAHLEIGQPKISGTIAPETTAPYTVIKTTPLNQALEINRPQSPDIITPEITASYVAIKNTLSNQVTSGNEFSVYLAETTLVPTSIPYSYFYNYFTALVHPIPRILWHSKPTLLDPHWSEFLEKSGIMPGSAETILGNLYAQLGTWGIIIGMFLSGILWKFFYEYLKKSPENRASILIYALIIPNMLTYVAQSPLIGFLKWLPYMVPVTVIALILSRKPSKNQ